MFARMQRKRISFALLVGMQVGVATPENSMEFLKKLKIELPYDAAITLLGIYPQDTGVLFQRGTYTPVFKFFFFNIYLFLRQRETEHEQGRGRERGRHRIGNRLQAPSHQPRA